MSQTKHSELELLQIMEDKLDSALKNAEISLSSDDYWKQKDAIKEKRKRIKEKQEYHTIRKYSDLKKEGIEISDVIDPTTEIGPRKRTGTESFLENIKDPRNRPFIGDLQETKNYIKLITYNNILITFFTC